MVDHARAIDVIFHKGKVADLGVVMALFLGIVLSSLFAGEWHDNTSTLVLTTRNGWGKIALAKILTGLAFTVELFALLAVSSVISQLFFMGTAGWDMPIQNGHALNIVRVDEAKEIAVVTTDTSLFQRNTIQYNQRVVAGIQ